MLQIPRLLDTDSYKETHHLMYPDDIESMTAYYTHRKNTLSTEDHRIVFFGMAWWYESMLSQPITWADLEEADLYLSTHGVAGQPYPYPRDLFEKIIRENKGYWPVEVRAIPDGSVVYPGVPCFTITASREYARLVTWLETSAMRVWSPTTTATKSALVKDILRGSFERTVDSEMHFLLMSRLHDFGSRGASSSETAMTAGAGHLLSFDGTDTLIAGAYATRLNNGSPIGQSVLATEHSVMTSWATELEATRMILRRTPPGQILSVVADSKDYHAFCRHILPQIAQEAKDRQVFFVLRPDSGKPVDMVLEGLTALGKAFGTVTNNKGYRVIDGAGLIQGDGLNLEMISEISRAVEKNGWSAQTVAYGMGGGLLQTQNRDTLGVAIKLCEKTVNGTRIPIMKRPVGDPTKISLPGDFSVVRTYDGPVVYPRYTSEDIEDRDELELIWDNGPVGWSPECFNDMRIRLETEWKHAPRTSNYNPLSQEMRDLLSRTLDTL